ncbi:MAG: thioredoxin, partial [Flavobacteriales bacterium CG_4_9_14_0_2_um_filter_35_242]
MRKLFYLFVVLSIVSCKKTPHDYVTLSGEITNLKVDTLTVYG